MPYTCRLREAAGDRERGIVERTTENRPTAFPALIGLTLSVVGFDLTVVDRQGPTRMLKKLFILRLLEKAQM